MDNKEENLELEKVETNLIDFGAKKKKKDKGDKKKKKKKDKDKNKDQDKEKDKDKEKEKGKSSKVKFEFPFTYEQMLERITGILTKNNPFSKKNKKMPLLSIEFERITSKKYKWSNFREFAEYINRQADHMAQFVGVSLGIDPILQEKALLLEGRRLDEETLQGVSRKYILEYVKCVYCRSTNTLLVKDPSIRKFIMECKDCKSSKTMAAIKVG